MSKANQATAAATSQIEWDAVEGSNTEFSAKYPRLQWIHGSKQSAGFMKVGGLFISKEEYPNFTGEGFEPFTLITRKGDEIDGYAASSANLAIIRIKHQWVKEDENGRNVPLAHVLCVIKGCVDLLCISLRGASKALDFQKAFNQHMGQNVSLANRTRPDSASAIEPFALWFPVTAGEQITITSKDGKNESSVTLPTMFVPETLDRDYVASLWVGKDNYKTFVSFYKETAAWQKSAIWEQRNDDETPTHTGGESFRVTEAQMEFLADLCAQKEIKMSELVASVTKGETDNIATLTFDEAHNVIEAAKAY